MITQLEFFFRLSFALSDVVGINHPLFVDANISLRAYSVTAAWNPHSLCVAETARYVATKPFVGGSITPIP